MMYYEMLLLLRSDISQDGYDSIKTSVEKIINDNKGTIKTVDRWGKYLLAYPIEKMSYGVYVLVRFGIPLSIDLKAFFAKIHTLCSVRFNSTVLRYVMVKQGLHMSDVYSKPDSLTDAPRKEYSEEIDSEKTLGDVLYRNKYDKNQSSNRNYNTTH